jgi:hypothetical protein
MSTEGSLLRSPQRPIEAMRSPEAVAGVRLAAPKSVRQSQVPPAQSRRRRAFRTGRFRSLRSWPVPLRPRGRRQKRRDATSVVIRMVDSEALPDPAPECGPLLSMAPFATPTPCVTWSPWPSTTFVNPGDVVVFPRSDDGWMRRHRRSLRFVAMAVAISLPRLGMSGVASAKAAKGCHKTHTCRSGGSSPTGSGSGAARPL